MEMSFFLFILRVLIIKSNYSGHHSFDSMPFKKKREVRGYFLIVHSSTNSLI